MSCEGCHWYDPYYGCDAPDFAWCGRDPDRIDGEYDGDAIFL